MDVKTAKAWLEREKRLNSPPAMRFIAMQAVGRALKDERESGRPERETEGG